MTFRMKHTDTHATMLGIHRSQLQNHKLYNSFKSIATRVMCDLFELNVDNCDKIPQEAIDYRDNLTDAMVSTVLVHTEKEEE